MSFNNWVLAYFDSQFIALITDQCEALRMQVLSGEIWRGEKNGRERLNLIFNV